MNSQRFRGFGFRWWVWVVLFLGFAGSAGIRASQSNGNEYGMKAASGDILYFVLLDRFANGTTCNDYSVNLKNPRASHGGDVQGLLQHLDYLEDLGITSLWVSPLFGNRPTPFYGQDSYHGYWPWDFFAVDFRFGNIPKIRELRSQLRKRGIKLVLDFVVNHMGYDAPFVASHPALFHQNGEIKDWNDPRQVETFGVFGLPDFASENPDVLRFFQSVARFWLELADPDGFRLDAVKHVPREFWNAFNRRLSWKRGRDFLLLGELMDGDPSNIARTWKEGRFTSVFDYPLYYTLLDVIARRGDARQLALRFFQDYQYPDARRIATFLDNHDVERFIVSCGGNESRYRLALILLLTARGIPTLCSGDEIGLGLRTPVEGEYRPDMNFDTASEMYQLTKRLIRWRKEFSSLSCGQQKMLVVGPDWLAFGRGTPCEQAIVVLNLATGAKTLNVPEEIPMAEIGSVACLLGPAPVQRTTSWQVKLPGDSACVFVVSAKKPQGFANWHEQREREARDPNAAGLINVRFTVNSRGLPANAEIYLTGGLSELGMWDPIKAPVMKKNHDSSWGLNCLLPRGAIFEFKFCARQNGKTLWPEGMKNYFEILPRKGSKVSLRRDWQPR